MTITRTVTATVTGRVQGVWFRGWTRQEALRLGLEGWVRNEVEGSVMACLSGPAERVSEMVALLHKRPPAARVDAVEVRASSAPTTQGFVVLR
ncbi:acylphosphatase [Ruegeria sp. 2012CJ41-6]|uniref:Acylphosphatase n=1 Tax=Ruegeria spongiae TaxID=2942209 RepID=A0ABT0Q3G2_9RHOB|nr:acylphosphatase [Ruegeria spongiae]MCL6283429.1 acylphosphatase [Ruegeria spongiae]